MFKKYMVYLDNLITFHAHVFIEIIMSLERIWISIFLKYERLECTIVRVQKHYNCYKLVLFIFCNYLTK